jgi:hypothetical protein
MTFNKNQHFVPKCHLRHFSDDHGGNSVNLYNVERGLHVRNAPIKGQCSRDYFYGKNPTVDDAIKEFESRYGQCMLKIKSGDFGRETRTNLLVFSYLQYHRTDSAARRQQRAMNDMFNEIDPDKTFFPPEAYWNTQKTVLESLRMVAKTTEFIFDLKTVIIENCTRTAFITSDDPAILANKFEAQKFNSDRFGLTSSGLMIVLPLAPEYLFLAFDAQVYNIENANSGYLKISKDTDVVALNQLQCIKAAKNVYFKHSNQASEIEDIVRNVSGMRRTSWSGVQALVEAEHQSGHGILYRIATPEEKDEKLTKIVITTNYYPRLSRWPTFIKNRVNPKFFVGKGSIGLVRRREWVSSGGRY